MSETTAKTVRLAPHAPDAPDGRTAPVVTVVCIGLSRLQRDAPEWVYWQAELIFLLGTRVRLQDDGGLLHLVGDVSFSEFSGFFGRGQGSAAIVRRAGSRCASLCFSAWL